MFLVLDPQKFMPSLADILRPLMETLKHVVVDIAVDVDDLYLLFGIPSELEDMRTENIVETVTIKIFVRLRGSHHRGDDWGHGRLDEVLTTPGWFSLKHVSLTVKAATYGKKYDGDELEVALGMLSEKQFPRLSSSTSVSFDFKVVAV